MCTHACPCVPLQRSNLLFASKPLPSLSTTSHTTLLALCLLAQLPNAAQALRLLDAIGAVKRLLGASDSDDAVLAGAKRWRAKDTDTKVPLGR